MKEKITILNDDDSYVLVAANEFDLLMAMAYEFGEYLTSLKELDPSLIENNLETLFDMMDELYCKLASIQIASKCTLCRQQREIKGKRVKIPTQGL